MKQKWILAVMLSVMLAVGLTACGAEAEVTSTPEPTVAPSATSTPQPMVFVLPWYEEAGLHPILGSSRTNLSIGGLLYDGLYELDQTFEPQPALAVAHAVSEGGGTWTFTLRQGVTFSDGSSLTAADVAYSLNLARSSALYGTRLAGITSVRGGEGTVEVVLSAPNGALPALLDVPVIKQGSNEARPAGTGLYALEGEGEQLLLRRREDSWRTERPSLETIPLHAVEQGDDLIYSFDTGDVSLVGTDITGSNSLGFSGSFETMDYPTANMLYVGFNSGSGVCQDRRVRQALSRGIDRNTICSALLSRHAVPAELPAHPASSIYDTALAKSASYAPQAMGELLLEAGWSKSDGKYTRRGKQMALTILVNQDNTYKLGVADELAREFTAAGIITSVDKRPWADYMVALQGGEFDLYLGEVKLTADFDPSPLLSGGALNYGKYAGSGTATLLAEFQGAKGTARNAAAKSLYENLGEEAPFAVLCFKNWSVLTQWGQLTGMTPTQQNLFYGFGNWEFTS